MRIRVFVRGNETVFDFEGFLGKACLSEFDRITGALSKLGFVVKVKELRMKNSSEVKNGTSLSERS
ncbi:MAG: hypothetical protein QXQ38_00690 [Archaeoglobaceae archaeon]|nr:hypothetical protein [Archaeoglobales archaeon]